MTTKFKFWEWLTEAVGKRPFDEVLPRFNLKIPWRLLLLSGYLPNVWCYRNLDHQEEGGVQIISSGF